MKEGVRSHIHLVNVSEQTEIEGEAADEELVAKFLELKKRIEVLKAHN